MCASPAVCAESPALACLGTAVFPAQSGRSAAVGAGLDAAFSGRSCVPDKRVALVGLVCLHSAHRLQILLILFVVLGGTKP